MAKKKQEVVPLRIGSSIVQNPNGKFGVVIHWVDGDIILGPRGDLDTIEEAKALGSELLQISRALMQEQGIATHKPNEPPPEGMKRSPLPADGHELRSITRAEFEDYNPQRLSEDEFAQMGVHIEERVWFVNKAETLLGVLVYEKDDQDWQAIVMGRDGARLFRCVTIEVSMDTRARAESALRRMMRDAYMSGN